MFPTSYDIIGHKRKFFSEIPGPTVKNTSPTTKKDYFKYSTPIEGPDNQFGSADRSDDEDDKEPLTEPTVKIHNIPKIDNNTKNKTLLFAVSNSVVKQKISDKVSKMLDKLELEPDHVKINQSQNLLASSFVVLLSIVTSDALCKLLHSQV